MQARPQREPPAYRRRRMRAGRFQAPFGAQSLGDRSRHAVLGVFLALLFVPEMMGDEAQHRRFRRRPSGRRVCRCPRPSLEIGEIRSERAKRVRARASLGEMRQRVDFRGVQRLCQTVPHRERQKAGERVDGEFVARAHDAPSGPRTMTPSARAPAASFLSSVASGRCSRNAKSR